MPIVLISRNLSLLEPSEPVKAFNGIASPLPLPCKETVSRTGFSQFNVENKRVLTTGDISLGCDFVSDRCLFKKGF
jgi:hypothetical protein